MKALKIILLALAFIAYQAHADEERNLAVKQVNNAVSEQRIALVIGNGAYTSSPLKNPVNDAKDMAKKLRGLGFVVIERSNLQTKQIGATLREFRSKLVPGAVALVFYAGHGLQIKGDNYLPAVDADINSEEDVPNQSLAVKQIMDVLDESKTRLNLVFLDACRNNPYARSFRSADKGLARVSAPSGTLISYATRPGSVAADGGGRNGLYTSKLLAQMNSTVQIEQALKRVVTEVKAASQGKQEPWMEGSIEGDFCFAGCAASGGAQVASLAPAPVVQNIPVTDDAEGILWQAAESSGIEEDVRTYLRQYPNGRYVALANARIQTFADDAVQTMLQKEQDVWQAAGKANTEAGYQEYLKAYPAGRFVALVSGRLEKLKSDQEPQFWQQAQTGGSAQAIQAYLDKYPSGSYVAAAREKLAAIKKAEDEMKPGKVFRDCPDCPEMVILPKSFAMGKYEVTQSQWKAIMGNNPSKFSNCGDTCPVENVSWNDAQEFIQKLNTKTGKQYRLPTEAEWEYACYGGSQSEYCGGNNLDAVGWAGSRTHPAGQKQANGYGLYDMSGNVWEWASDCWEGDCAKRVLRGASWGGLSPGGRAAARNWSGPADRFNYGGFRLVRTLP
ncbi:MAG: SUMF1/EgtB/PvdO family nonheme iron enzyme [Gallionella sp.]|nr:SUMF1/EgtB/PvdO family nonheme iron enzyme [Gallionella sp.]